MLTWTTPFDRYAVTRFFTPPRLTSVDSTVALVPSSKVRIAADQSSTSSHEVTSHFLASAWKAGTLVSWATSARTDFTRIGFPNFRWPS
jgi:hypothetical protein